MCKDVFSKDAIRTLQQVIHDYWKGCLQLPDKVIYPVLDQVIDDITRYKQVGLEMSYSTLDASGIRRLWNLDLDHNRAKSISSWISPYLTGDAVLDLFCGNCRISESLLENAPLDIEMVDRYISPGTKCIHYEHWRKDLTYNSKRYHTALLITALHHEPDPADILSFIRTLVARRVIIVENCVDEMYSDEFHQLIDLFFNISLNKSELESPGSHFTQDSLLKSLSDHGTVQHVETRPGVPGIPLNHTLIILDLN
jgi:hypothetical protein